MTPAELAGDPEWQRLFATDPVLNALEAEQYDEESDRLLLAGALHFPLMIGHLPIRPLTPARWALLWMLGNGYARYHDTVTAEDMEQMLFILTHDLRRLTVTLDALASAGAGWGVECGLEIEDLHAALKQLIRAAFSPLAALPEDPDAEPARYDGQWLCRIASLAARESGLDLEYCKFEMSLGEVCAIYVDAARRNSAPDYAARIRRRPPAEVEAAIMRRTRELQKEFLAKRS